jgi:predicted enzyme related to lactoylglutathione lyase
MEMTASQSAFSIGEEMSPSIRRLIRSDTVMFEYDVHDMQRAVEWYTEVIGLEIIFKGGDCHTEFALPVSGARLALSRTDKDKPVRKAARLFLRTDDLDAVEAALRSKGARTGPKEDAGGAVRILWVEDPEGNPLAFEQWSGRA